METKQNKKKATRKITSMNFDGLGAAVSLVGPSVGGPANGIPTLVFKASKFTDEHIAKASKVKVTMELPEFLQTFYNLYADDAEILARALGFNTDTSGNTEPTTYEDYITSKVQSIEVIKSLHEADKLSDVLKDLDPEDYLVMLEDQLTLEKAFKKVKRLQEGNLDAQLAQVEKALEAEEQEVTQAVTEKESEAVVKATESDTSTVLVEKTVEPSGSEIIKSKEKHMTVEVKANAEMVDKSAFEAIQKSLDENKVALTKALETIAVFEAEKKEQIVKAKSAKFSAVLKDEKVLTPIVKAALSLESDEDFDAFLAAITSMQSNIVTTQEFVEKSALFKEVGASVSEEDTVKESAVARILKSKQSK
jgi:hypothetical protein